MEQVTTNIVPSQPQSPEQNGSNNNSNGETHPSADSSTNHVDDEGALFDADKTIIHADAPAVSCDTDQPKDCAPSQRPIQNHSGPVTNRRASQNSTRSSVSSGGRRSSFLLGRFSRRNTDEERGEDAAPHLRRATSHKRNRSIRGSMTKMGQSITWAQLARRRSTEYDGRRPSQGSSDNMDGLVTNGDGERRKEQVFCCKSAQAAIVHRYESLVISTKKASKHPRTIVLPTLLTFAILTGAGLFAIFYSCHQYRKDQSQHLLEESRELAYLLDDLLSKALLPLFTLRELSRQFTEFTQLRRDVDEYQPNYKDEGRAFRNVTSICTEKVLIDLYWKAAESIVKDSRMGDGLLNVQLQPGK
jgi:hypothetical protein